MTINSEQIKELLIDEDEQMIDEFLKRWNPDNEKSFEIEFEDFIKDAFALFKVIRTLVIMFKKETSFKWN